MQERCIIVTIITVFLLGCQDIPQPEGETGISETSETQSLEPATQPLGQQASRDIKAPPQMVPLTERKAPGSLTDNLEPTQNSSEALRMAVDILRPSTHSLQSDIVEAAFWDFARAVADNEQTLVNYIALTLKHGDNVAPEEKELTCLASSSLAVPLSTLWWHIEGKNPENIEYINALLLKSLGYIQVALMHIGCDRALTRDDLFVE